jgi:predicted enzyme related to lactoylglutathione lyase
MGYDVSIAKETNMQPTHSMIFYVKDPLTTADFYTKVLGHGPAEASPGFAMFMLNDATAMGFWKRDDVAPPATEHGGASEIGFQALDIDDVNARHDKWKALGVAVIQKPTQMDFGFTFTAVDPDGHRLRVFAS